MRLFPSSDFVNLDFTENPFPSCHMQVKICTVFLEGYRMKRALITGGSGDIGAAICKQLATEGNHVIIHANSNGERARQVASDIREHGGTAETVIFDVTDANQSRETVEKLLETGPIQILINNAGIYDDAPLAGMNRNQWHSVIDVSLHGFYNVTRPLLLPMITTRWGRIISITSVTAIKGNRGQTNYAAAKAGVHAASKSLALELAKRKITVNCVAPGIIEGKIRENEFDRETIRQLVPMQRAGRPKEVADLVSFLASERAAYISGQTISINGAMS